MTEERMLSIRFYKNIYGDKELQKNVLEEIKKAKCPTKIDQMEVEEGRSMLMIGESLIFSHESTIQEILSEITAIIERCYLHEIANKK